MRFNLKASDMLLYIPKLNRNITVSRRVVEFHFFFFSFSIKRSAQRVLAGAPGKTVLLILVLSRFSTMNNDFYVHFY